MDSAASSNDARREGRLELIDRACPICGSTESRLFAEGNFDPAKLGEFAFASRKRPEYMHHRLVICTTCDLLYSTPAPKLEALESEYLSASFDASDESRYASKTYGSFLAKIAENLPDRVGALDIGTGDGSFLEELLRHGFTGVTGVEPSAAPIAAADPSVRALIRHGTFRANDYQPEQFRLVTCFQTLEHVYEPFELCRDAYRLLKPRGALFVVCHNRRAVLARIMGRKSPIFDIEHLQLFSPKSLRRMFERVGFTRIETRVVVNRYPMKYWVRLFPVPDGPKNAILSAMDSSGLGSLTLAAPVGNIAVIGYR